MRRALCLTLALVLLTPWLVEAQGLPAAPPEAVGLSAARLGRLGALVEEDVRKGRIPGAVVLIARKGRVAYHEAWGLRDPIAREPMPRDAIFPIYSMTKPITSVAVMLLVEEGRIQLSHPVSRYLPQLAKLEVGVVKRDPATGQETLERVPSERDMTVQDLLRHTSGLTYGVFGKSPVKELYLKAGIQSRDHTNAEFVDRIARLPLHYQPGTTWEYSHSTDVLGRLVEVVSGMTLGRFFAERIFGPLRMPDTAFWMPADKHGRIAHALPADPDSGQPIRLLDLTGPRKFESGGGGAASTALDYARFAQMLLNRGQLDGVRLLGRKTVEQMTADQLGGIKFPGPGYSFGLGFGVRVATGLAAQPGSAGEYYWGGFGGTAFFVDPQEELVALWMALGPGQRSHYRPLFKNLVMQAVVD